MSKNCQFKPKKRYYSAFLVLFIVYLLLLLIDLVLFSSKPWPYASGGGTAFISLGKSFFWEQYAEHCLYFQLTSFSENILFITSLISGIFCGSYLNNFETESEIPFRNRESFRIYLFIFTVIILLGLINYTWNHKVNGGLVNGPMIFLITLIFLNIEIPLTIVRKKPIWLILIQIPLIIIYFMVFLIFLFSQACF